MLIMTTTLASIVSQAEVPVTGEVPEGYVACMARNEEGFCGEVVEAKDISYIGHTAYCPACYQRWFLQQD